MTAYPPAGYRHTPGVAGIPEPQAPAEATTRLEATVRELRGEYLPAMDGTWTGGVAIDPKDIATRSNEVGFDDPVRHGPLPEGLDADEEARYRQEEERVARAHEAEFDRRKQAALRMFRTYAHERALGGDMLVAKARKGIDVPEC